ncbi:MAG: vanadium-dependent haloperoxidase [Sphingobacteriales bacterium]|nr:MAG: vanadium-dependent haloperoxidase [Sphingobacteriales bacterium]
MKNLSSGLLFLLLLFAIAFVSGCKEDENEFDTTEDFSAEVAHKWFDLTRKLTKETAGFTPPVAARAYAYTGIALYESVAGGSDHLHSLAGQISGLSQSAVSKPNSTEEYHWGIVANSCLTDIVKKLYPNATDENKTRIDSLSLAVEQSLSAGVDVEVFDRSVAHGKTVADEIYNYSVTDGQDQGYTSNFPASYIPPVGDGFWVPTPPAFLNAMQPYWGDVRPFVSDNITGTQPEAPIPFSTEATSAFYEEAYEVYETGQNLTAEQTLIAQFWSDDPGKTGTPGGHSISITTQVLRKQNANLGLAAETYVKVGMAINDAFISCWRCKYLFNLLRPITYIKQYIDPDYTTLLTTPPFPEYTSGHSVQTGAMATILTDMFGNNYAFTDSTHVSRTDIDGSPRSYDSFMDAANETAISRLYGGIHYRKAIEKGVIQGSQIGQNIIQKIEYHH